MEEALQDACARAVTPGCCRGTSEGEVYTWLRSVALSRIRDRREHARHRHELLVAWASDGPDEPAGEQGADVEVLRREKERELDELAKLAVTHMTERQRSVVALASHDFRVKQIARRLDTSDSQRRAHQGEGLRAGPAHTGRRRRRRLRRGRAADQPARVRNREPDRARRGPATSHRLRALRHAASAARTLSPEDRGLLPVPATTQADPALLERALHKTTQAAGQLKQQLAENTAQAKQRLAETASQTKQQLADAASHTKQQTVARVAEYSPLAGARPAATATAIAGCLAIGAGGGAYCLHQNVNPIGPPRRRHREAGAGPAAAQAAEEGQGSPAARRPAAKHRPGAAAGARARARPGDRAGRAAAGARARSRPGDRAGRAAARANAAGGGVRRTDQPRPCRAGAERPGQTRPRPGVRRRRPVRTLNDTTPQGAPMRPTRSSRLPLLAALVVLAGAALGVGAAPAAAGTYRDQRVWGRLAERAPLDAVVWELRQPRHALEAGLRAGG